MLSADTSLINSLYSSSKIDTSITCYIEYNMNSMVEDITVTSSGEYTANGNKPYKKLFPAESVIQAFRPVNPGVKYYIYTNSGDKSKVSNGTGEPGASKSPRTLIPSSTLPRIYLPGADTFYKYWATNINTDASISVSYPKFVMSNKIIIKFEKYHEIPSSCSVVITYSDNSTVSKTGLIPDANGLLDLYYTGSDWSEDASLISLSSQKNIISIALTAVNKNQDRAIAVIEISPRLVRDISSDIISLSINKEASNSSDGTLPVGSVTSNTLTLSALRYDTSEMKYISYDKAIASPNHLSSDKIYLFKNAEIKPFFNVKVGSEIKKIQQGTYYINEYSIDTYGETSITALDGSKYLMETVAPDLLCQDYPVTSIITRLLDTVGFTNYNFNTTSTATAVDDSIMTVKYFWTDDTRTVWETIQELCMDIQMTAVFDENNVLQFYTRNYMYSDKAIPDFAFYYDKYRDVATSTDRYPNIVSFSKKEVPATNQVIIRWQVPQISNYQMSSSPLWQSPIQILTAGSLTKNLLKNQSKELMPNGDSNYVVHLEPNVIGTYAKNFSVYNYAGYFLINSEVIEYDAIGYQYTPIDGGAKQFFWATSQTDIEKYKLLSKPIDPGKDVYFGPAGVYRLKEDTTNSTTGRGMLGTTSADHYIGQVTGWTTNGGVIIK